MIMSQGSFIEEKRFQLGVETKHGSEISGKLMGRIFKRRESRPFGLELGKEVMLTEHLLCAICHVLSSIF